MNSKRLSNDWHILGFTCLTVILIYSIYSEMDKFHSRLISQFVKIWLLTMPGTIAAVLLMRAMGWIDGHGIPAGPWGFLVGGMITFVTDIKGDFLLALKFSIAALIILVGRWVLDTRFGYQTVPRPLEIARIVLRIFAYAVTKSCFVVCGVVAILALFGLMWKQLNSQQVIGIELAAAVLIVVGLIFIWLLNQITYIFEKLPD
ncbi:hypothetical protein [Pararobbsia alpina]|uniref:hypothetical protein n=1 Tax=Pararobbsia alpina TaxID=621374 RepID=UPI0039A6C1F6